MVDYLPSERYIIDDNVEAMKICVEQGILTHLLLPKGTTLNVGYHAFQRGQHWCLASFHVGHEKEDDNGYMVVMVPVSELTKEQAGVFFMELMKENSSGVLQFHWKDISVKSN